ncbi:hypothetical protein [Robinsoniella peoriensis]|uniref:hypothetical protein n=1 Tax=Robinsoniella peoriensis TaxID=180332 RepID=UPI0005C7BEA0|nr:hypothetical protein [Robinsoniella peoriensis]
MYYKEDWEKAKARLTALWDNEILDRCCISVAAPRDGKTNVHIFAPGECNPNDPEDLEDYWMNPERIWKRNILRLEHTYFGGESLPLVMPNFGASGHCVYYGGKYTLKADTIWFDSVVEDLEEHQWKYDRENRFYRRQREIVQYLAEKGMGNYLLSMPDNCGTLDAIGHLHGSMETMMDMYSCPGAVQAAISTINEGWTDAAETFYQLGKNCNEGGSCVGWMDTWAPGRHAQMQCDMSVMFSPDCYQKFVVPELKKQMEWEEYPVYHFDGKEQISHLDHLLDLKELQMIQWTNVDGQESPAHFIPALKRMQEAGKKILVLTPASDIPALLDNLSSRGLYLHTYADTVDEANKIIRYVEKNTHA